MGDKIKLLYFLIQIYVFNSVKCSPRIDPLVHTNMGLIRGVTATDGDYSMFMGIPFALVDENNPFGDAISPPPFEGTFEAYDDSAICPQREEFNATIAGTLDCLHLNVYVPSSASTHNRLPVLVWIYGGGFSIGFGGKTLYGPKYLVRHDVILVTINYRLGPYGFLCLDIPEVPGNQGLKDQLLGLKWVKENIESFGGDANQITIMGESAGGMSVDLHVHSESEKYFNKVIIQSGTAFAPFTLKDNHRNALLNMANILGFSTDDINQALKFLASCDPLLVIAASENIGSFMPCIEQKFENVKSFITKHPVNSNIPKVKNVPVLIGFVEYESLSLYYHQGPEFYENWNDIKEKMSMVFNHTEEELADLENIIRHFYIGDDQISMDVRFELAEYGTDFTFLYPTERAIDKYLENDAGDIFYYMFSYVGIRNWSRWKNNIIEGGAVHADEIGYLFDVSFWQNDQNTPDDQMTIDRMTTMWTNFVKYSEPIPETSELLPVKWEPITSKESPRYYMNIGADLSVSQRPFHDRMAFWELFFSANKNNLIGYESNK